MKKQKKIFPAPGGFRGIKELKISKWSDEWKITTFIHSEKYTAMAVIMLILFSALVPI